MYALGNYSRFVRPGFYRIDVANNGFTQISAYKNPTNGQFAIVAINASPTPIAQTFDLANFTTLSVTPWVTSATQALASQPPVTVANAAFTYTLPASSIVTFTGQQVILPQSIAISSAALTTNGFVLTWNQLVGASYSVYETNQLGGGTNWPVLVTGYPATNPANDFISYTDTTATVNSGPGFYRVTSP
jgi:hypothetical protein